ncbi:MAG: efflux RND transporter permease subunit, partial [Muribaculaceae bacterium]|nr:efflux RND transporter permease subunit [Muribaculaceae bacterium]
MDEKTIATTLFAQGFKTTGGNIKNTGYTSPIYVEKPINSVKEIQDLIILSLPSGQVVRLSDIAEVKLEYPEADSYITNNGEKCILLSVEMKPGNNIVEMGKLVSAQLDEFKKTLPEDVKMFEITNQPVVVNDSVWDFMRELLIAIVAVVIAILLLLPLRVALIAASTIPITIFVSIGLFYLFGFELNTVTLACLIVSLGMIVDNSVVIIDDYVELIGEGMDRKEATLRSTSEFFKSIFSATLAISVTFFPFLFTMTGMFKDFLLDFPWAILIILMGSFIIAELLVPFLQYALIKPTKAKEISENSGGKKHFSFLTLLQSSYDKLITWCFKYPIGLGAITLVVMVIGIWLFVKSPMQMMPIAERNQFAVEIFLPTNTSIERTSEIADSLEAILAKDDRVVSIANFHGCSSPRFQTTYAPQIGGPNFAQFIVNTVSNDATEDVLHEYTSKYEAYFPDAVILFKQLSYSDAAYPIELKISGSNLAELQAVSDTILGIMRRNPDITIPRTSLDMPSIATLVKPDAVQLSRIGKTTGNIELDLALRYSSGVPVGTLWDGKHSTDVVLKSTEADHSDANELSNGLLPTLGMTSVPLSQIADVVPKPVYGQISHLNGIKTIYLSALIPWDKNTIDVTSGLMKEVDKVPLPEGVSVNYGGEWESTMTVIPQMGGALMMAVVIIFLILLFHYKNIRLSIFLLFTLVFCLPGAGFGLWIEGISISVTCTLGIISLMGILVRNVIIMIDYAEEIQVTDGLSVKEAILDSAKRRMRPIFLTSSAASMGVIPMVLGKSPLWMPMGSVIFWGTIITMFFILTIIPILY